MNKKLKCIIIDDELKDIENVKMLLKLYCPQIEVIGQASDKCSIIDILSNHTPDLVFLDVNIGNICIFDILSELEHIDFNIVFVTAHHEYAIQGYKYDAIDYLLKPLDPISLNKVVGKIQKLNKESKPKDIFMKDFKAMYAKVREVAKITVTDAKGMHIIKIPDLLYCLSRGNYTSSMKTEQSEIIISKNLKYFQDKLKNYDFFRIHRSYLVNIDHISSLVKEMGGSVLMKNGESLPISRSSKKELFEKINSLKL